ncbi:MAG: hypothetical protein EXS03_00130 [Phycisphaerales bacterium]|nr:hypothetical protein [Phycisphaerales bacterium]
MLAMLPPTLVTLLVTVAALCAPLAFTAGGRLGATQACVCIDGCSSYGGLVTEHGSILAQRARATSPGRSIPTDRGAAGFAWHLRAITLCLGAAPPPSTRL